MVRETDAIYDPNAWSKLPQYGVEQLKGPQKLPLYDILTRDLQVEESVLDVGCGAGRLAQVISRLLYHVNYVGIDITPSYIDLARHTFPQYEWRIGDARRLPFPDQSFDRVWCCNLLIHLPWDDIQVALDEMKRVAKKAIYLYSLFDNRSNVNVMKSEDVLFLCNTIPFKDLKSDGWVLKEKYLKPDRGQTVNFEEESYAVLRKKY